MNVIVDDLLVNYRRQGEGRQILLLHGWGDRLETFDELAKRLQDDYEVIRLDLAGFGQSQAPTTTWGLDDYANYVAKFLNKINVVPSVILGHSNGGAIAIKGLATGVFKTDDLILLASAGVRNTRTSRKLAWNLTAKAGKPIASLLPKSARQSLRSKLYRSAGSDLLVAPHLEETFKRIVSEDVRNDAKILTQPSVIINGTADLDTPLEHAKLLQECIRNSSLEAVDGADHFLHQHHTDTVAAIIREFLKS